MKRRFIFTFTFLSAISLLQPVAAENYSPNKLINETEKESISNNVKEEWEFYSVVKEWAKLNTSKQ